MMQEGHGQSAGYGPARAGRPVEMVPYDHSAMGDHTHQQNVPSVTVQQTQMQIAGLDLANAMTMIPNSSVAAGSPTKEALRSEVACLLNQIDQVKIYAQTYNDEQKIVYLKKLNKLLKDSA